jgi:hypothetical protein
MPHFPIGLDRVVLNSVQGQLYVYLYKVTSRLSKILGYQFFLVTAITE